MNGGWPGERDADGHRIGAEARIGAAEGRDDRARDHVDEADRHQALGDRILGPLADAAQVVRVRERHHAHAVLLRAPDRDFGRLGADHLPVARLPVERDQRPAVELDHRVAVGRQAAFLERLDVARDHAHAVRVVPGQVGGDQVLGHQARLAGSLPPAATIASIARVRGSLLNVKVFAMVGRSVI